MRFLSGNLALGQREAGVLVAEAHRTWRATFMAEHPHGGDGVPLRRLSRAPGVHSHPPIKPGCSRLLVDTINISSNTIKINISFFGVSLSGFLFRPTKRAFTKTAPTLGKNTQGELWLNTVAISSTRHCFNS